MASLEGAYLGPEVCSPAVQRHCTLLRTPMFKSFQSETHRDDYPAVLPPAIERQPPPPTSAPALTAQSPDRSIWLLAVLSPLMGFASISTDLYLPALPTMAQALRSDAGGMELTISGYLIGFSVGQLLWGPLGDR